MPHDLYMKRCLELAQKGKGLVAPNPMVGAVLVYNDRIISEGWHHEYGKDHAEVDCLKKVKEVDRHLIPDSTMYVNLEPCAHHGKTPPCAYRLVQEGIKRVVIANDDPFEKVNGRGIQILKNARVEVIPGILEQEGLWVNRRFFTFRKQRRPYIILKWAQTCDGYLGPADGSRLQISNKHSMQLLHKWRTEEAAIMVGTTTALNDNPALTARLWSGRQPLRIIADRGLIIPETHQVYNSDAPTWILNELQERQTGNIKLVKISSGPDFLAGLSPKLYDAGIMSLIVEGGAQLLNSFLSAGVWDEARIFKGNVAIGNGIAAPLLRNEQKMMTAKLDQDELGVYLNNEGGYSYTYGQEL